MKKLPSKINISGVIFDIIEVDNHLDVSSNKDILCNGAILFTEQQIRIYSKLKHDTKISVFFHEVLHGCLNMVAPTMKEEVEEDITTKLAHILSDTLTRNNLLK